MTLNTTRSKVPYICVTSVPEYQISARFSLRPATFELKAFFAESAPNDPKRPWTLRGEIKIPHICVTNVPESQIWPHFALQPTVFKILLDDWTLDDWTLTSPNYLAHTKYLLPRSKFWSVSPYGKPFLRYKVVKNWNKKHRGFDDRLVKMADHDNIKLDCIQIYRCMLRSKTCRFRNTTLLKIANTPNDPTITLSII